MIKAWVLHQTVERNPLMELRENKAAMLNGKEEQRRRLAEAKAMEVGIMVGFKSRIVA